MEIITEGSNSLSRQSMASSLMRKYSTLADKKIKRKMTFVKNKIKKAQPLLQPRILIIDGTNCYLRRFSVHQYGHNKDRQLTDRNGMESGAVYTMVMMLNKMCTEFKATHAFVCWQGYNSKRNRSKINQQYKQNRVIKKSSSFVPQLKRVQQYIGLLPMHQMKVDFAEADDIIALLTREYPNYEKIIISQDQDFLQLVNDRLKTKVYFPRKKLLFDEKKVIQKYECHPRNFIYKKIITGDGSDNIKGINGVGPKTIQKQIGQLLINGKVESVADLIQKCKSQKLKPKLIQSKQLLQNNASIMSLHSNSDMLSLQSIQAFKSQLSKVVGFDNRQVRIMMAFDNVYGQTIQKVVRQMTMMEYLKKKWILKRIGETDESRKS